MSHATRSTATGEVMYAEYLTTRPDPNTKGFALITKLMQESRTLKAQNDALLALVREMLEQMPGTAAPFILGRSINDRARALLAQIDGGAR